MLQILIGLCAALAIFLIIVMIVDGNRFVTVTYEITSDKLTKPYEFLMLSDLHNKQYGKGNRKLLEAIDRLRPQGIFIAGDMLTATPGKSVAVAADFVTALAALYPVYYENGNHEYRVKMYPEDYGDMYPAYAARLGKAGIRPLENEHTVLPEQNICVYGLEIEREYYHRLHKKKLDTSHLEGLLGKPQRNAFNILLAHNPVYFPEYADWGADLVLSGHVHGGIIRLPFLGGVISPAFRLFPRYDGGYYEEGEARMVLGRGLGGHTIPVRIFNPGELVRIRLLPKQGNCRGLTGERGYENK